MDQLPLPRNSLRVDRVWIANVPPPGSMYWDWVRVVARKLGVYEENTSDACLEYRVHRHLSTTIYGAPITLLQSLRRYVKAHFR
jgi:hypothetical protein